MVLQPTPQSSEEPVHKIMQEYTDTLYATQKESNLTTTMLQDIPIFDGQDSSKLKDWFIDIETAADIWTDSHMHMAKAKHMASPAHSSVRPPKQGSLGMKSKAS